MTIDMDGRTASAFRILQRNVLGRCELRRKMKMELCNAL